MTKVQTLLFATLLCLISLSTEAQHSVAHRWMSVHLEANERDFQKPTVHARNLWHTSAAMYDAWAVYDPIASAYLLGDSLGEYAINFDGMPAPSDTIAAQEQAISYAAYRMMEHRYSGAPFPGNTEIPFMLDTLMLNLGYNSSFTSTDYANDGPAALGNYIAQELIAAALLDQSNESNDYVNQYYESVNEPIIIDEANFMGNPNLYSLNRWQSIGITLFCDAGGNPFSYAPEFLSAEWGQVIPFALADSVKSILPREGHDWVLYHDPGPPPYIALDGGQETDAYHWNYKVVTDWSSFLDPENPSMMDISPMSIGNTTIEDLPSDQAALEAFYDWDNGGVTGGGYALNPKTGLPYESHVVKRGDYARSIAEYWSNNSPPYWYGAYNEVSQAAEFTWLWNGEGEALSELEYDVKSYFTLGGAMHDAAIAAWGTKGYYDYIRPVSAIRAMAELGQSTDQLLPNYHPAGLELEDGYVEFIQLGDTIHINDTIQIADVEDVNLLKMKCWVGPLVNDTCISGIPPDYDTTHAGVGWKYALDFWPYQRPTYVSPPYAGYVSGQAAYASAAAEVLTLVTGDSYFPGGLAEFECLQDDFLVFENGPSETITLQWATYQDAANQAGMSRIFAGVNTPIDELTGRTIGHEVGQNAFILAETYFYGTVPEVQSVTISDLLITDADDGSTLTLTIEYGQPMDMTANPSVTPDFGENTLIFSTGLWENDFIYIASFIIADIQEFSPQVSFEILEGSNISGLVQSTPFITETLHIDMLNPAIETVTASEEIIDNSMIGINAFHIEISFDDEVDQSFIPVLFFPMEDPSATLELNTGTSDWVSVNTYRFDYDVNEGLSALALIDLELSNVFDTVGNPIENSLTADVFSIDIVSGLEDLPHTVQFIVYPNPAGNGEEILVQFNNEIIQGTIQLLDPLGRIIEVWVVNSGSHSGLRIETRGLSAGNYSLNYIYGNQHSEHPIVIVD